MDKSILEIVGNFALWKGDTYKLAALIAARQRELDKEALMAANHTDAAEVL